ncbi:MAG TPA: glycosyltransferase 87 family protein [Micromonosporaceae bacterium]
MFERLTGTERRWVVGGVVAALLAVVGFAGPWGPRMIDLEVYRAGADALRHGTDLYAASEPSTGLVFTYPVFAAMLFVPFSLLPDSLARGALTLLSLGALFVVVYLTVRHVRRARSTAGPRGTTLTWSIGLSVGAIAVHPVWETLTFGQVNVILAAMVMVDLLTTRTGRWRGVLVGIAAGIKLVPGIFIVYLLVTGQRRSALYAALSTLATVLIGFAVQPGPQWAFWTRYVRDPDRTGGIAYVTNQSFLGVSARLLRDPHPPGALSLALGVFVLVVALLLAARLTRAGDAFTAVTVVAVASLLASPVSWSHHWVWVVPCLGTLVVWARTGRPGAWRWWVLGVVAAIVASGPMQFTPKEQLRELHDTLPQQFVANIYALLALVFLGWLAVRTLRTADRSVTVSPASAPTA